MKENILNFSVHEHIHYFAKKPLIKLFEKYGFSVETVHDFNSPSIIIIGRATDNRALTFQQYEKTTATINENVMKLIRNASGKVHLYGAGLTLSKLIYENIWEKEVRDKVLIIDDNPVVNRKFMPFFDKEISLYNKNNILENDVVILVLNSVYQDKVLKKIREDGLGNAVYGINQQGFVRL